MKNSTRVGARIAKKFVTVVLCLSLIIGCLFLPRVVMQVTDIMTIDKNEYRDADSFSLNFNTNRRSILEKITIIKSAASYQEVEDFFYSPEENLEYYREMIRRSFEGLQLSEYGYHFPYNKITAVSAKKYLVTDHMDRNVVVISINFRAPGIECDLRIDEETNLIVKMGLYLKDSIEKTKYFFNDKGDFVQALNYYYYDNLSKFEGYTEYSKFLSDRVDYSNEYRVVFN